MSDYQHALHTAIEAAREAGTILRNDLHRSDGPRGGGSHADADDEAEQIIRQRLLAATDWSYLGEETGSHDGNDSRHRWLVDPNDGTAAYLKGWRGSAVSIAALRDDVPVLGVVFAFSYPDDDGDLIAWAEGCGPITRNGEPVSNDLTSASLDATSIIFVSQDADRRAEANQVAVHPARIIAMPSIAYRLALAAVGDGIAGVSLSGPGAWDYAAGHALLRAVGGTLLDERGSEVSYSSGRSSTRFCFGGAHAACEALCRRDWSALLSGRSHPVALIRPERGRLIRDPGRLSRAQGCLLGQLAGDSLGGLVEFRGPDEIRRQYPNGLRELADGGVWGILAGQPTDDSELALMLARTLAKGSFDEGQVLSAYRFWRDSRPFDMGRTTSMGLAGRPDAHSQANGSLMRISPLGIFGAHRPADAAIWARADSRITHPNSVCQDACAAFVTAIAEAITNGCGPQATYEAAQREASKPDFSPSVRECLTGKTRIACAVVHAVLDAGGRAAVVVPHGLMHQWIAESRKLRASSPAPKELTTFTEFLREASATDASWKDIAASWKDIAPRPDQSEWWLISHGFRGPLVRGNSYWWRAALPALVGVNLAKRAERENAQTRIGKLCRHIERAPASWWNWRGMARIASEMAPRVRERHDLRTRIMAMPELSIARESNDALLAQFGNGGDGRPLTEELLGLWLGEFDLLVIDEAHKSRGDVDVEDTTLERPRARCLRVLSMCC